MGTAGRREPAEQVVLHEKKGAEQERAESEREHHRDGLVGRPEQIRETLAPDVRPAGREPPPEAANQEPRREPEDPEHGGDAGGEDRRGAETAHLQRGEQDDARRERRDRRPAPRIPPRPPRARTPAGAPPAASRGARRGAGAPQRSARSTAPFRFRAGWRPAPAPPGRPRAASPRAAPAASVAPPRRAPHRGGSRRCRGRPPEAGRWRRPDRRWRPRQRRTAMVSSFRRMKTTTALPTPMPPSRSAISATSPR